MTIIATRLKSLRKEKKLTQRQLASKLQISQSTVALYETGNREPDIDTLEKIADFFDVTLDYLAGRTDHPKEFLKYPGETLAFHRSDDPMDDLPPEAQKEVEQFKAYIRHKYRQKFEEKEK